jgi:hypothetical protein
MPIFGLHRSCHIVRTFFVFFSNIYCIFRLQATASAGNGNFNSATALDISALAEAINGEGNTIIIDRMNSHGASMNGSYNQIICSGTLSYGAVTGGDRNVVSVDGTNAIGTADESSDSQVPSVGRMCSARCMKSDRSIVTAVAGRNANALVLHGSDNLAAAQANDTAVMIMDSGSYNQANASVVGCHITISNDGMGYEVQQCQ